MIAAAIDKIITLVKDPVTYVEGEPFTSEHLKMLDTERRAEPLSVRTLTSLVRYIKEFEESWKDLPLLIHVASPTKVELLTALDNERRRECLMRAEADLPQFAFRTFIENEKMVIAVQSMFVDDSATHKADILKFAGTVTSGSIKEYGDDGVTQKATVKKGISMKDEKIVPSPCVLRPYRTFIEVEQPASRFIFRMREEKDGRIESALFDADGGAWKNEAVENVCLYLEAELKDMVLCGRKITVIA